MSAVNIWIEPDRAFVCTDDVASCNGHFFRASKAAVLPHAGVVIASRGVLNTLPSLMCVLWHVPSAQDFDTCAPAMPEAIR
jgi:hypothetical protein